MNKNELIRLAFEARKRCYAPYSGYGVGAALLTESGLIYQGCNVENASYGGTICAERTAALKAVYDGERSFAAIAIVGFSLGGDGRTASYPYPCGICRQFLREFAAPHMRFYVARTEDDVLEVTLAEILPHSFGPENLD